MNNKADPTTMESEKKRELEPKLRFPVFRDAGDWEARQLGDTCERITEKVGRAKLTPVSITAGYGFVSQVDKFGRDISGAQYKNYTFLRRGDFAYNRGYSKKYPQGYVCQLKEFDQAAASTAFICFRLRPEYEEGFLQGLFESNFHGRQLAKYITSSARGDGLLNINPDHFFSMKLPFPQELDEQRKIANCLSALDDLIAAQSQKLDTLNAHKQGLLQQLFPAEGETLPKLRFPEFQDAAEWEEKSLAFLCDMRAGQYVAAPDISEHDEDGLYPCYGGNGLRGYTKTFTHSGTYPLIGRQGALCGNVNLAKGRFHATEHAVVATAASNINVEWLFYNLVNLNLNQYATGQAQPGLSVAVLERVNTAVPTDIKEQRKIADCLSSLDERIAAQSQKLDTLKKHKKGLMQQLFPSPEEVSR